MQVQMKFSISNLQGQLSCWLSPSQLSQPVETATFFGQLLTLDLQSFSS